MKRSPIMRSVIPGQPVPKGRPRVTTRGGKARTYTPARTRLWETLAADKFQRDWMGANKSKYHVVPADRPVSLSLEAVFERPQRLSKKKDFAGRIVHDKRPDIDNVIKAVLDSLTTAGVLIDDSRVESVTARKRYAAKGEGPCVEVELYESTGTITGDNNGQQRE